MTETLNETGASLALAAARNTMEHKLEPALVALMVGIGIPLSL